MTLLQRRLRTQRMYGNPLHTAEDVVRLLCAVQSQDYPGAKWSVGQRVRDATDSSIDDAFNQGKILRTHVLRPTWHFVLPEDIRWIVELTAPRVQRINSYEWPGHGLDAKLMMRSLKVIFDTLQKENHCTRPELAQALARGGVNAVGPRLAHIAMHAELERLICSGPLRGKQHTYALLEERAPHAPGLDRDEALAKLALRFFEGHAPATIKHFAWWSGLTIADCRAGLEAVRSKLHAERDAAGVEWIGGGGDTPRARNDAWLIPEYDESLIGSRDFGIRDTVSGKVGAAGDGFIRPIIIGDLRAGTWRRSLTGATAVLETRLFGKLDSSQARALQRTANQYERFLELPLRLI